MSDTIAASVVATLKEASYSVPPFARQCLEAAGESFGASFTHPFVVALADGTLESDVFKFYQVQDARYLEAFSDAAAILSTRCVDPADKLWCIDAARVALVTEGELHAGYGELLGYTAADIAEIEITPNNAAYQNHMISSAMRGSPVEGLAALAPCPWLYIALGQHVLREIGTIEDSHPYAAWLRMYSDPGFNTFIDQMLERLQRFADAADEAERKRAIEAFVTSCRYEWMFWDQAWTNQQWPV